MKTLLTAILLGAASILHADSPADDQALQEKLVSVVPSDVQYRWQRLHEYYAFIHFGPNTFTLRQWGTGKEDPSVFNPTALDASQWVRALKSAGMTMAVLTAKHHDGFCLWPTRYTGQSVKSSPWEGGKGDVVREFVNAAHAQGLAVGFYLSPADLYQIEGPQSYYGDGSPYVTSVIPTDPAHIKDNPTRSRPIPAGAPNFTFQADDYNRYYMNELYELLTEYGPVDEVWFDGALPKSRGGQKYSFPDWYAMIRKLQPNAVIANCGPDIHWVGNEKGQGNETQWNVVGLSMPLDQYRGSGFRDITMDRATLSRAVALHWNPAEADVSILPDWFYNPREVNAVKSPSQLMDLYLASVGRNVPLILNVPPDSRGLFTDNEVNALRAFGERLQATYSTNLAAGATVTASSALDGHPASSILDGNYETYWEAQPWQHSVGLDLVLPKAVTFNRILLQEQIRRSQRVEAFEVDAEVNGQWTTLSSATTIGYKRILPIPDTTASHLRIHFGQFRVAPTLAEFGLYRDNGS